VPPGREEGLADAARSKCCGPPAPPDALPPALPGLDPRIERDHAAISDLADDVLPALIAKLATSGLGEIEVREGAWKARLRRPAGADDRKGSGRGSVGGHSGQGHAPAAGRPRPPGVLPPRIASGSPARRMRPWRRRTSRSWRSRRQWASFSRARIWSPGCGFGPAIVWARLTCSASARTWSRRWTA